MTGAEPGPKDPSLVREQAFFSEGARFVIGVDEVGRGAIAGPVAVGAHAIEAGTTAFPEGLRDSKLLTERRREALLPKVIDWGAGAVGYVEAERIVDWGITRALGEAARLALLDLHAQGIPVESAIILLDGSQDWLTPVLRRPLAVRTMVGADRACASVAAASVRAKTGRDARMREAHEAHPHYGWDRNKGYGAPAHYAGIDAHGLTVLHRTSWIRRSSADPRSGSGSEPGPGDPGVPPPAAGPSEAAPAAED